VHRRVAPVDGCQGIGDKFQNAAADVDYFAETARIVHGTGAWAMVAARLGRRKYRNDFADRFWWKSMRFVLSRPVAPDWPAAVARFRAARAKVQKLYEERTVVDQALIRLSSDPGLAGIVHHAIGRWGDRVPYGSVGEVGSVIVNDPANRTQIGIDIAVLAPPEPGRPRRLLSLGEVKWAR
jgi:hypothetical protein